MLQRPLLTLALVSALAFGCRTVPVVSPSTSVDGPATAQQVAAVLGEAGISCEITKETFVHCNIDGTDGVLAVTLASTGRQLTLMVPVQQPACGVPEFHAKVAKFNSDFILVSAACLDNDTLMLSHRTHLFRGGLDKADLQDIVKKWFPTAFALAAEQGLLAPAAATAPSEPPPPPAKKGKEPTKDPGAGKI